MIVTILSRRQANIADELVHNTDEERYHHNTDDNI